MVKMAGRKLWNDQDVVTAVSLLKGADSSLAEMNDPSLLAIRRAINEDIGNLAALSKIDNDGTILQLNQLANQVDNLRLSGFERDGSPMDKMMKPFQARFLTGSKTSVKAGKALWMTLLLSVVETVPLFHY